MVKQNVTKGIKAVKKKAIKKKPVKITKPAKTANIAKLIEADVEISPVATAKIQRSIIFTNDTGSQIVLNYRTGPGARTILANISKTDTDGKGVNLSSGDQLSLTLNGTLIF